MDGIEHPLTEESLILLDLTCALSLSDLNGSSCGRLEREYIWWHERHIENKRSDHILLLRRYTDFFFSEAKYSEIFDPSA